MPRPKTKVASKKASAKKPKTTQTSVRAKVVPKKKVTKTTSTQTDGPRMLKAPKYTSFRLRRRNKKNRPSRLSPPKVRDLWRQTWRVVKERPKLFVGIALVHLMLTLFLVRGFSSQVDLAGTRDILGQFYSGATGKAITTVSLFGQLVSSGNSATASASASAYQSMSAVVVALAAVWAARQQGSKTPITVRDAFYRGMYPLIPFVIVLLVVGVQLIPAAIGGWLYSTVVVGGIATSIIEKLLWLTLVLILITLSFYMITSSVFALFIVTLPDMTPRRALRSARKLVAHRRWAIAAKIVAMTLWLFVSAGAIMLPFLLIVPAVAEYIFVLLSAFAIVVPMVYLYNLYYGLLQ